MLVLWLIVVLGAIAASVVATARSSISVAENLKARTAARYAAESGIVLAAATLRDSLAILTDTIARHRYLDRLDIALGRRAEVKLGDAQLAIALVDVNARLDINAAAGTPALATFLAQFVGPVDAEHIARTIGDRIGSDEPAPPSASELTVGTPTGGAPGRARRPLRSLDELTQIPGISHTLAARLAPYLTVDGDGRINRVTAPDTVLAAATGDLVNEPSRILIVSRGWLAGRPLTHEIQAVYAIEQKELKLVRWRESDR